MAIYTIKTPSGRELDIQADTPEAAQRGAKEWEAKQGTPDRTGQAIERGFFRGASFDMLDELNALIRAGGGDVNDPDPAKAIAALARGGYRKITSDPEAQRLYDEELMKQRAYQQGLEEQHPNVTLGAQIAGGATMPFGAAARTATIGGRAIAASKTGAAVGALTGFGQGEGAQGSAIGAAIGAPVGAATGAALTPVVEGATALATRAARPVTNLVRGMINPDEEALRRIGIAGVRDARIAVPGASDAPLTAAEYAAAEQAGLPVAAIDRLGTTGRALARSSADTSPEALAALTRATQERFQGQSPRMGGFVREQAQYPNVEAQQAAIEDVQRATNTAAYRRAYAEGANMPPPARLLDMANSDEVRAAMLSAEKKAQSAAVEEGVNYAPLNARAYVDEAGQLTWRNKGGAPTYPDLRYWDYTRRELSQMANAAERSGYGSDAARLRSFARQMNEQLDAAVPSYAQARAGAAGFFNANNALEAGQSFVGAGEKFGLRPARAALARMSENERQLFHDGYADRLAQTLTQTRDTTNVLNKIGNSDAAREELAIGLGSQERAQEFIARRRVEQVMDRMRGALGGSQTARNLAFAGLAGGAAGGIDLYNTGSLVHAGGAGGAAALFAGGLRQVATRLGQHIDERVAQRVGEMLASPDASVVDRGIRIVANNRTMANALQALDTMTARVGGQQAAQRVNQLTGQ